ncbi:OstA-like protein [Candidatus Koribacter versatilis Ellin345]|uniref:OstA-like protein n=1 Tax=Koribacter versatilis (strain Ellin345) TaxID=204669 RepID=Q1IR39_KORVE|nr:LPS export ABC transporter periplasmic protein LptC [Candidatus Koribacter versatilis]ABF40661.1 OstA-like protein [Candidatus Koribacter versatilis Ellin345]
MSFSITRLRIWFAVATITLVVVVTGVYLVRRYEQRVLLHIAAKKLGVEIQQSTEGFSLSKSEGGRTLFKISAKKATQYKETGRAALQDVSIVVYGRDGSRFDQIYGANFEYDNKTGNVTARGEVDIDLEANAQGPKRPDQATPAELKNPIHLKTSGLVFNQKTGLAHTDESIEFHVPQANGSARGVDYDSHTNRLTLNSEIKVATLGPTPQNLVAVHAVITKEPRRAVLSHVTVKQPDSTITSDTVTIAFRSDNTIEQIFADGNVEADNNGVNSYQVQAAKANLKFGADNDLQLTTLSDGTRFRSSGERPMHGFSDRIFVHFDQATQPTNIRLADNAHIIEEPAGSGPSHSQQRTEIVADALDIDVRNGKLPSKAATSGKAQVNIDQRASGNQPPTTTVVTAGRFVADFSKQGHINHILGQPNSRVVSSAAGQAERTTTADKLEVLYNEKGELASVLQQGNFRYHEALPANQGERTATAEKATYSPSDELLRLTGSPRITDGGMSLTASLVNINRHTGEATADGNVKSTYSQLKEQPNGAMLAASDPIHVTAKKMIALKNGGAATYSGGSRLWQGANTVEAPTIEFNRDQRSLVAQGTGQAASPVTSVFVQKDKDGKITPVNITARKLTYVDAERRARYEGGVTARTTDGVLTADHVDVYLKESGASTSPTAQPGPSQLDRIIAQGTVVLAQPGRRATGNKLTYFQQDGRFVLSGDNPAIADAEHGTVRGESLTFFSKDDRVLVEGSNAAPTVTHTRVSR